MKTIKRKANVGERIKIIRAISPTGLYARGDKFTVRSSGNMGVRVEGILPIISHMEYEVIIEEERVEIPHTTYIELARSIDNHVHDALQKAYEEGYRKGKTDTEFERAFRDIAKVTSEIRREGVRRLTPKETPQQARDRIVEQAKKDVEGLKYKDTDFYASIGRFACVAVFIVNKEKRTVVTLLRGGSSNIVRAKGIAKCAPGDCFNVHIGKVISLRRAMGLEVPAEYLNAPQPTEVRVGDILRVDTGKDGVHEMTVENDGKPIRGRFHARSRFAREGKIIDDSRE